MCGFCYSAYGEIYGTSWREMGLWVTIGVRAAKTSDVEVADEVCIKDSEPRDEYLC